MDADILFCPIYDKLLKEMLSERNKAETNKEKLRIMLKFANKFTLLSEELLEFKRLCGRCNQKIVADDYSALYSRQHGNENDKHIEWSNTKYIASHLYNDNCKNRFEIVDEALTFPHKFLEDLNGGRLNESVFPVPTHVKRQFNSSKIIYDEMKACENDIDKWLECIKKIENKEAVIANLELKLGQDSNWKNKKLWKFYFNFLKENNMIEILDVFRKYTRLFVCDKQAVTRYRNELDKFSSWNIPTTKYWVDTIKYEKEFGTLESAYHVLQRAIKAVIGKPYYFVVKHKNDLSKKLMKFKKEMMQIEELESSAQLSKNEAKETLTSVKPAAFFFQNVKLQYLCFHQSFFHNLFKNAKGLILRKLYSTCKFFYLLKNAPLCYRLRINGYRKTSYCGESLFLNEKDIDFAGLNNLHVYCILDIRNNRARDLIPKILPKLKICDIQYLHIENQDFSVCDLKFMLSGNIYQVILCNVNIRDDDGESINGNKTCEMFKSYSSLRCVEAVNRKHFISGYPGGNSRLAIWKSVVEGFRFKTIYIYHQTFSIAELQMLIHYEHLKNIRLSSVTVKDENGSVMDNDQLEEFIKTSVNPLNNVCIEIV